MSREAMEQASKCITELCTMLNTLGFSTITHYKLSGAETRAYAVLDALRAALSAPEQPAVAYMIWGPMKGPAQFTTDPTAPARTKFRADYVCTPLYAAPTAQPADFQARVGEWMQECFGPAISADKIERNHRFLEEALELVQACGCTAGEAHQLVDYVFHRPTGERHQEVGGVMVTLAALCRAQFIGMEQAGNDELARVWTKIDTIRAKQAVKPKHSPLPEAQPAGKVQVPVELSQQYWDGVWARISADGHIKNCASVVQVKRILDICHAAMLAAAQESKQS